ncbi:hypothetical protein [Methylobrevis pamukkalensis]|uniref:Uncharacterized protein n=1 Tax=Methylobrevis pamukkalensis TaxID=1439726 RepID=A0A1E3H8S2_9HYPH|nr:hypothetical protein [Methylobrevis pamukkalensis]ODN72196.1 hypothetical protein A6302_00494 [Methylobrevis pamukkalensis]
MDLSPAECAEAQELHEEIQKAIAGHGARPVIAALTHNIACCVAQVAAVKGPEFVAALTAEVCEEAQQIALDNMSFVLEALRKAGQVPPEPRRLQ